MTNITYERFKEIWDKEFKENPPSGIDATPETIAALTAAANGDMSYFDKIASQQRKVDNFYEPEKNNHD